MRAFNLEEASFALTYNLNNHNSNLNLNHNNRNNLDVKPSP